ncbi:MAG TPA: CPBP family intramembrane glutamic endopeptidase [Rubrobacter sp.]|nr:CPBP family intramembrane glutamic endopeptidase [Rubrobacter sp.]
MFPKLTDTSKATIFTVLVLLMALAMALLFRAGGLTSEGPVIGLYMCTPALAALLMLLVITRDGFSREGWKGLGLHRLGLSVWWIAIGVTFLTSLVASAIVWATPLASFVVPEGGLGNPLLQFLIGVVTMTLTFSLGEELGWRGYLLPQLLSVGRTRALVVVGLIWAAWHMPLIFLTPLYHSAGNRLIVLPLFVGTIVAASFVFGYLRILTGSVWPASLAHSVHNVAWSTLGALTATSSPVVVNEYLAGDNGILILIATAVVAVWLGRRVSRKLGSGSSKSQPRVASGEAPAL